MVATKEVKFDVHNNPTPPQNPLDQALEIQARSYRNEVTKATWRGRSRGFWAGIALGIAFGGAIGACAALATAILPAITLTMAAGLVPITAAAFAATGMTLGALVCTSVGASANAVAGGLKEQDRRMVEAKMEEGKTIAESYSPALDEDHQKPPSGFLKQFTEGSSKIFKWKVAAFGLLAGAAVGGLLIAASGGLAAGATAIPALKVIGGVIGKAISTELVASGVASSVASGVAEAAVGPALAVMTMVGTSLFGGVFGLDMPNIATNTMNFMGKILSGEIFDKDKGKAHVPVKEVAHTVSKTVVAVTPEKPTITAEESQALQEKLAARNRPMFVAQENDRKAALESPAIQFQR